jgi:hypothetical protein
MNGGKKKKIEGEEIFIATCKIEIQWNRSVASEEEKLIVKMNAMKSQ